MMQAAFPILAVVFDFGNVLAMFDRPAQCRQLARRLFMNEELATVPEGYEFSFKVGTMKPDPAIWRHLLRTAGLEAGQCLYIDDEPPFCRAAEALGFTAIRYERGRTDLLRRLRELL